MFKNGTICVDDESLQSIPKETFLYQDIKRLILTNVKISTLPKKVGTLISLTHLNLSGSLGEKTSLSLYGRKPLLQSLPAEIANLKNLRELILDSNSFHVFPPAICDLERLETLSMNYNCLETLPNEVNKLQRLTVLCLDDNLFQTMPVVIYHLSSLETLSMEYCRMETIPDGISNLKSLDCLALEGNQIEKLPADFGLLTSLKYLRLPNNSFTELPVTFG